MVFNRALRLMLVNNGIILFVAGLLTPLYAIYVEEIGGRLIDVSIAASVLPFAAAITVLIAGYIADKTDEDVMIMVVGSVFITLGFFLYLFTHSMAMVILNQALIGIGEAIYAPAFDSVYSLHLNKKKAGRQWGAWEAMRYVTLSASALIGGVIIVQTGFHTLFFIMTLASLFNLIYLFFYGREIINSHKINK
jgi:MFS family permease